MTTASASFLLHSSLISPILIPHLLPFPSSSSSTETMKNCEKSQILMLSLILILLIVTPLLSSSVRTTYLYIITNLLIIALGAQAGILRAFSKPVDHHEKKNPVFVPQKPVLVAPSELASTEKRIAAQNDEDQRVANWQCSEKNIVPNKVVAKSKSQKVTGTVKTETVRKCPSMPSLFFIGSAENETEAVCSDDDDDDVVEDFHPIEEEEEEVADLSGQELLIKAEKFIGNFYKQLKMQREESWKRIHGMYHKAF